MLSRCISALTRCARSDIKVVSQPATRKTNRTPMISDAINSRLQKAPVCLNIHTRKLIMPNSRQLIILHKPHRNLQTPDHRQTRHCRKSSNNRFFIISIVLNLCYFSVFSNDIVCSPFQPQTTEEIIKFCNRLLSEIPKF